MPGALASRYTFQYPDRDFKGTGWLSWGVFLGDHPGHIAGKRKAIIQETLLFRSTNLCMSGALYGLKSSRKDS